MRGFLATLSILAVVGLTMAFFGWLTFKETPNGAGATIHTERIEDDVNTAVKTTTDAVSDVVDQAAEVTK
jgi:hypothetical protein